MPNPEAIAEIESEYKTWDTFIGHVYPVQGLETTLAILEAAYTPDRFNPDMNDNQEESD